MQPRVGACPEPERRRREEGSSLLEFLRAHQQNARRREPGANSHSRTFHEAGEFNFAKKRASAPV